MLYYSYLHYITIVIYEKIIYILIYVYHRVLHYVFHPGLYIRIVNAKHNIII